MRKVYPTLAIAALVWAMTLPAAGAQTVPVAMQAEFYAKMLPLVEDSPTVTIVYGHDAAKAGNALRDAFAGQNVSADTRDEDAAAQADGDVIFLSKTLSERAASKFSNVDRVVITDSYAFLKAGYATFMINSEKGRMKLKANLAHIKNNGLRIPGTILNASDPVGI